MLFFFMLLPLSFHFHFSFRNIHVIGFPHIFSIGPRMIFLPLFFFLLPPFLVSLLDKLKLSFLKKIKEVIDRKEYSQKVENYVASCIELCFVISDSSVKHDICPGQSQRNNNIDDVSEDHVPFLLTHHCSNWIFFLEER